MTQPLSILVSNPLGPNLTRGKLLPLLELPEVGEIIVVQDAPGPPLRKVRYVTIGQPKAGRAGKALHLCRRVITLATEIFRSRPSVVMGIYTMPHGLIAYLLGRLTRRRVCIHVIGGPNEVIDGGYWIDQWPVVWPSKRIESLYIGILRRTDAVMVVGTETKRYLVSKGVSDDRVHVMSSKIDPRRFRPLPRERDYDLIFTAQLIPRKRVDLFLRIVADLKTRYPRIRAAILGTGPLRGEMEELANSLGLGDRVEFLGFHEHTECYYNRAKVFVLTSSAEGLSLAMLEAMACGLPVVVPAVGDLSDVVQNGVTGYLIEDAGRAGFVGALGTLLGNERLRDTIGDNARSTILHGYTVEDGARLWSDVLPALQADPLSTLARARADSAQAAAAQR